MIIDNLDTIKFKAAVDDENLSVKFFDVSDVEIGEIRLKKERMRNFLTALTTICRENYSEYEPHEKLSAKMENKQEGFITF